MIALISGWVKNIILIVLFATFLELLLPTSSLQRFVRVIMGLLIMLTILNPAIDVIHGNWTGGDIPTLSASSKKQVDIIHNANQVAEERDRIAGEIYKRDLTKQVRALVMAVDGVADARIAIEFQKRPGGGMGAIHKITIFVKPGNIAQIGSVPKVSVDSPQHPELELKDSVKNKIRIMIKELYQIRDDQIDILAWK
jgi:stage III sporulation protein AF